jgi:uncharacterized protein (DUF433 family)
MPWWLAQPAPRINPGGQAMDNNYVSVVDNVYRITGTRVSLDSIVYDYLSGLSPETIADNFDSVSLEQVYGAITFYLSHRDEADKHLISNRAKFDALRKKARKSHLLLYRKLEEMHEALPWKSGSKPMLIFAGPSSKDWDAASSSEGIIEERY